MTWISNQHTRALVNKYVHLIPNDFDYHAYISMHPDLVLAGIDDYQKAAEHYLFFGRRENRVYKRHTVPEIPVADPVPEHWGIGQNILYFAPMAPDYDISGGGQRLLQILKILKKDLLYNIWFLCNGYRSKHHIDAVKKLDIPVYMPNIDKQEYLDKNLEEASKNKIQFNAAIFSWYDIGHQYIPIVKKYYPDIKIIVDSVDIHWVREQRGKDNNQLNIPQEMLDLRKKTEKYTYSLANVILTVTEDDKKHIQKELGYGSNIKIVSTIHEKKDIDLGKDICFIGNYNHGPNIDAVIECVSIYNSFQNTNTYKKLKYKPKLLLAGPNLDISIQNQINHYKHIQYLGYVSNIEDVYKQSSIMLAPINWGAGIKSKICDAGMCGMPILTSDIGNEGIGFIHQKNALIANSTQEFVENLEYFFGSNSKIRTTIGKSGQNHLNNIVSAKAATTVLKHSLETKHVVISIIAFNQTEKLAKCLDSILLKTKYENYAIVISDNSSDGTIKKYISSYLKKYKNKIRYIKNSSNLYFIEANNNVFTDPKYKNSDVVLINDDVEILSEHWLNYLYSSAYSADYIAAVGAKTIFPDNKLAEAGAELYRDGTGRNKGRYQDPNDIIYNIPMYTGYCSGCLLYMRRDALNQLGIFSKELDYLYYEDAEWQYRAHIHGLKTLYEPRCVAIHDEGSSSGTDLTSGPKKYQQINRVKFLQIMKQMGCDNIEIYNE